MAAVFTRAMHTLPRSFAVHRLMGNSGSYQIPIQLHYELLPGDYRTPKASFGLQPADPMSFPPVE
jgi:hypothetical protein